MNENYINTVIHFVMENLDKTELNCYKTEKLFINANSVQVIFFVTKNNKEYYILENIYYDENIELVSKYITENIILNMKYKY